MKVVVGSRLPPDTTGETREDPVPVYAMGQRVELFATFTDDAGALADTTVALRVRDAAGTVTTPSPTNVSTGLYTYQLDIPLAAASAGVWAFRFEGTVTVVAAGERRLQVPASPFYS